MKNKKIILGLGAITALGAMSMGFVACKKTEPKKDENNKDDKGGVVYFNDLSINQQTEIFNEWLKNIIEDAKKDNPDDSSKKISVTDFTTTTESNKWAKDSKVSKLIEEVEKIPGFEDRFEIEIDDTEKKANLKDGKQKLTIKKKGVDVTNNKNTHLKKEIEFKFTLKAA